MTGGRGNGTMRWGRPVQVLRDEDNQTRAVHQHRPLDEFPIYRVELCAFLSLDKES